jgi:DNA-binding GntR family transcriptional regulator
MNARKPAKAAPRKRRAGAGRPKSAAPKLPTLSPMNSISIERQVYQALRHALMSGSIAPGATLTSRPISVALGVSPTPVREALKRLESDGALLGFNKRAFYVSDPDQVDFAELLEIRLNLEVQAIRAAARRATFSDLEPIREINREYERLLASDDDVEGVGNVLLINFRFHFEIYKLSGSPLLVQLIETLWLRIGPSLNRFVVHYKHSDISNFHGQMLDALARQDPDGAEAALRSDLVIAARAVLPQLRARPAS